MIFVGADVHVRNTYLHATDGDGRRLAHGRVANAAADLRAFCTRLLEAVDGELQPVRFVLESTTNSRALQRQLRRAARDAGSQAVATDVLDARKLRIIAESVAKCDAVDARILNELARANLKLPTCYIPTDDEFALRERLRGRHDLVRLRTMLKNQAAAVLHRRAILKPHGGVWTSAGRQYLAQLELDAAGRELLDQYVTLADQLDTVIRQATQALQRVARQPRWAKPAALLQTMPGVGVITALTLLAELGDLSRFKNRSAVSNYAGLTPIQRDSNQKHYRGGITHRGPSHLRAVLVEAAWMTLPRVPRYRAAFDRIAVKKNKLVAVVAVARRLLEDAWVMLRREEAFCFAPTPRADERTVVASVAG